MNEVRLYGLKDYPSKYEFQLWYLDNQTQFWSELQKYARGAALTEITNFLNNAWRISKLAPGILKFIPLKATRIRTM